MKYVLVTGAAGFIGRNLIEALGRQEGVVVLTHVRADGGEHLQQNLRKADVVFHLAGVNRPKTEAEFATGNAVCTSDLCDRLRELGRTPKIVFASSTQAALDNPYGLSKREAEAEIARFSADTGAEVAIFRLKNVFGKWCRPNYNSAVATFCHNIARGLPIQVSDPNRDIDLVYIDDVVAAFLGELHGGSTKPDIRDIEVSQKVSLGRLVELIESFRASRRNLVMPDLLDPFTKKLYSTYLSYLPEDEFAYSLEKRVDDRGELAEFIKSAHFGQVFVSRTKPGISRGNHYHHTKVEKFLVLDGDAVIRFRHIERPDVLEYRVSGTQMKVVDIPPGYTHSIDNSGPTELIVLFWASEIFDPTRPDTYALKVVDVNCTPEPDSKLPNHRPNAKAA